ncbi:MAG: hypothetical protein MJH10_20000 [Epibacterium sp.]|nr:hypothetical protein [Epibacterium sp.]NQX75763.1 hypothetical protein [Epibacterium sp.]
MTPTPQTRELHTLQRERKRLLTRIETEGGGHAVAASLLARCDQLKARMNEIRREKA